jgi:hypothetical protein
VPRWNRVGPDGLRGQRRGPRSRMRDWFARHPFTTFAIGIAGLGWLTWWEAARIETAHGTVAQGWGTGLAVGIAASVGLTAAWWAMLLVTRGQLVRRQTATVVLGVILAVSFVLCLKTTLPPSGTAAPYVITTGIEVGEIAYVATFSAYFIAAIIWGGTRLFRRRPH